MTVQAVEEVLRRAQEDPDFRRRLETDPDTAMHGYDIDYEERAAIISGDSDRLQELGVSAALSDLAPDYHPRRQDPL